MASIASGEGAAGASPALSVVMPAYNEAGNIAAAIADVIEHVLAVVPDAEVVVVDDGSRDDTAAIAERVASTEPRVRVIRQRNSGHGPALVRGIAAARGARVLLLDSDRQIGLSRFAETWRLAGGCDAVLGVREARADPRYRRLLSATLRLGLSRVLAVAAADANAPYKLVARGHLHQAIARMPAAPRIPSILLVVHLRRTGARVLEQSVPHAARRAGESTLKVRRLARFCAGALAELLRFERALRREPR